MTRLSAISCLAAIAALAAGCASRGDGHRTVQTWIGAPEAQLRSQWGEPTAAVAANGETILQYKTTRSLHLDARPATQTVATAGMPSTTIPGSPAMDISMSCTWSFALRAGLVVRAEGAGNDCASTPGPARAM